MTGCFAVTIRFQRATVTRTLNPRGVRASNEEIVGVHWHGRHSGLVYGN
jgi:hypothetical protein